MMNVIKKSASTISYDFKAVGRTVEIRYEVGATIIEQWWKDAHTSYVLAGGVFDVHEAFSHNRLRELIIRKSKNIES